jgi:hypothetical protein
MKLKKVTPVFEDDWGVCLWQMTDGSFLGDDDGNFLSLAGYVNDLRIEKKMQDAAIEWVGDSAELGQAVWIPGARQVSDEEHKEQTERFERGEIPDLAESARRGR